MAPVCVILSLGLWSWISPPGRALRGVVCRALWHVMAAACPWPHALLPCRGRVTLLPLVLLVLLNARLIVEIRRSSRYLQLHLGRDMRVRLVLPGLYLRISVF